MRVADPRFALILVALMCVTGCATNPVPREWRVPAAVAQRSPRGSWITIKPTGASAAGTPIVEGELIAIDETAIHVLTATGLQSVPRASSHRITVVVYRKYSGALAAWAAGGGASTLSHGGFLILTLPMWAVAGVVTAWAEARAGVVHDEETAHRFARFPQGLPAGLDPKSLGVLKIAPRRQERR